MKIKAIMLHFLIMIKWEFSLLKLIKEFREFTDFVFHSGLTESQFPRRQARTSGGPLSPPDRSASTLYSRWTHQHPSIDRDSVRRWAASWRKHYSQSPSLFPSDSWICEWVQWDEKLWKFHAELAIFCWPLVVILIQLSWISLVWTQEN